MNTPLISAIKSIIQLSQEEEDIILNLFQLKNHKKGDFFLKEGEVCRQVGYIIKGIFRYYINEDGEEKTYGFSKENEFMGNYESFVPQSHSNQLIQALEDTEVWVISYAGLKEFYAKISGGEKFGRTIIEHVFVQTETVIFYSSLCV